MCPPAARSCAHASGPPSRGLSVQVRLWAPFLPPAAAPAAAAAAALGLAWPEGHGGKVKLTHHAAFVSGVCASSDLSVAVSAGWDGSVWAIQPRSGRASLLHR